MLRGFFDVRLGLSCVRVFLVCAELVPSHSPLAISHSIHHQAGTQTRTEAPTVTFKLTSSLLRAIDSEAACFIAVC